MPAFIGGGLVGSIGGFFMALIFLGTVIVAYMDVNKKNDDLFMSVDD